MAKQILFFHGGGSEDDYRADEALVQSLRSELGVAYSIRYPFLPNDGTPDLGRRQQIRRELASADEGVIIAAHSLGASMVLVCLSEEVTAKKIDGLFLLATPFWSGSEEWVDAFRLRTHFADKLDRSIPTYFYHCRDDEEVPFSHFEIYRKEVPWATFREQLSGGHQFGNNLSPVGSDILGLEYAQ